MHRRNRIGRTLAVYALAMAVTGLAALAAWRMDQLEAQRQEVALRAQVSDRLTTVRTRLEQAMGAPLLRTRGVLAQLMAQGDITPEAFHKVAEVLLAGHRNVRNIAVSRGTVFAMVYPEEGNEAVLGLDLRTVPDQWPLAEQAIRTRQPVLQGPVKLVQGGFGVLGRVPVYLPGADGQDRFFGLITVVVDLPGVLADAGLDDPRLDIVVALRGRDGLGAAGEVFLGPAELFDQDPVQAEVTLPFGRWQIAAIPRDGWHAWEDDMKGSRGLRMAMVALVALASLGMASYMVRRAELARAKRDSVARYRSLFTNAKIAMLVVDPADGRIVDANDEAGRFYGYGVDRLRTMRISDINPKPPAELSMDMVRALKESRNHFQFRHRVADGGERDVEVHSGPIQLDGKTLLFSIVHDITDRRQLEAERQRLVLAVQQSPASIVITNPDKVIEYVNDAFCHHTGYSRDEVLGQTPAVLRSGETSDAEYAAMWEQLNAGKSWSGVFHNRRKDGTLYWENAQISPIMDEDGRITHFVGVKENITERREAERAIQALTRQLEDVLAACSEVAVIATDPAGTITLFNRGAERMLGFAAEEMVGRLTPEAFHVAGQVAARAAEQGMAPGFPSIVAIAEAEGRDLREWDYRRKDGSLLTVSLAITPIRSDAGEPTGYLGVAVDISERKLAEARLQASEQRFRALVEGTTDWVWETDENHRFSWVSESCLRMLGLDEDQVLGRTRQELYPGLDAMNEQVWSAYATALDTRQRFRDLRYWAQTRHGPRWMSISGAPRFDESGRFLGYRGSGTDITATAETAQRLKMLSQLVEQSPIAVVITGRDGRVEYLNDEACRRAGQPRARLMGAAAAAIPGWRLSDQALEQLRSGGTWKGETCHQGFDGSPVWEQATVFPVTDDSSAISHYVAILEDITFRKDAETRLAQQSEELARSNAELEQFAYVASHDLRQPLRMVNSYLTLLARKLDDTLDDDARLYIHYAVDGAKRMDGLIVDLLEYSRVGRVARPFERVELDQAVAEVLQDLDAAIAESGATVAVAPGAPAVDGDPTELRRLFQNLIDNAIKYRSPDRPPEISIQWRRDGGGVCTAMVRDNGMGIPAKDHERVFGIFQRLVSRERYEGSGIGLAVCRKIVEHHGGRIWVESEPGQGSTFCLTLPEAAENRP